MPSQLHAGPQPIPTIPDRPTRSIHTATANGEDNDVRPAAVDSGQSASPARRSTFQGSRSPGERRLRREHSGRDNPPARNAGPTQRPPDTSRTPRREAPRAGKLRPETPPL